MHVLAGLLVANGLLVVVVLAAVASRVDLDDGLGGSAARTRMRRMKGRARE